MACLELLSMPFVYLTIKENYMKPVKPIKVPKKREDVIDLIIAQYEGVKAEMDEKIAALELEKASLLS